jgi:hypothetical protein
MLQDPGITSITNSIDYILTLSGRGLVIAFVIASYFKKVRWGYQFDELQERCNKLEKDRNDFLQMALRSTELNERIANVAGKSTVDKQ